MRLAVVLSLPVTTWYCVTDRFSGVSSVTVTGRITYALARDGAFPCSHFFARVNEKLRTPVNSIMMVFIFDACLLLLQLGDNSAVAFNNIVSTCRLVGLLLIFLSASSSCGGGVDTRVV